MYKNTECLKLDQMESDLVLACKAWYGDKGVEKVIGHYCNYDPEHCDIRSKYHFISELIVKLIDNGHLRLTTLINELSPMNINGFAEMDKDLAASNKIYNRMVSMICGLQINEQDKDGNYYALIELHEVNEKFREKEVEIDQEVNIK
jgi:hypothetical protein